MKLNLTHAQLTEIFAARFVGTPSAVLVQEVVYDSRKISRSESVAFFGLNGPKRSGFEFVQTAYDKGIRIFVLDQQPAKEFAEACFYIVDDVLEALQQLATFHRKRINYPILAIAGAIGKTTVKEWLYQLLHPSFNIVRSPRSFNSQVGVPLSVWKMDSSYDLAIFEAGISTTGEMQQLASIIKP